MKVLIYITTFLSMTFISCEKEIELDINHLKPVIVVNSIIYPDSLFKANISKSAGILDSDVYAGVVDTEIVDYLEHAKVYVSDENNNILEQLHYLSKGNYISNTFKPEAGHIYNLKVINDSLKDISAVQKIPVPVEITDVKTSATADVTMNGTFRELTVDVEFNDPKGENYYIFSILNPSDNNRKIGYSFDKSFFELKRTSSSPEITKVLDNSVLGIINNNEKDYGETCELIFSDVLISNKKVKFKIRENWFYQFNEPDSIEQIAVLYSISKDYYIYLKSIANYSTLDQYLTERTPVYVNIKNGLGIFAGCSSKSKPFKFNWTSNSVSNEKVYTSFNYDNHNYLLDLYKGYGIFTYPVPDSTMVQCTFHYSNGIDNFRFCISEMLKRTSAFSSDKNTRIQLARQILEEKEYNYTAIDYNSAGVKIEYYQAEYNQQFETYFPESYRSYINPFNSPWWDGISVVNQENSVFKITNKEVQPDGTIICECEFSCNLMNSSNQTMTLKQGKIRFVL